MYAVGAVAAALVAPFWSGGRWLSVHLFTLGVLTNTVMAMSRHFAATLTRTRDNDAGTPLWLGNVGTAALVGGRVAQLAWLVAAGAAVVAAAVALNLRSMRSMRRAAVGARFAFVVRSYEWAHAAFLVGAVLGTLLGLGALPGRWYGAGRLAHMHVNVLGFAGLTLLATLVFFGPTMLRARIHPGADRIAARALRWGTAALALTVAALVATGAGGAWEATARISAGVALAGYCVVTLAICAPVVLAARRVGSTHLRPAVVGACAWLVTGIALDAAAVTLQSRALLDAAAIAVLIGALAQSIVAATTYVAAVVRGDSRTQQRGPARGVVMNLGVALMIASIPIGGGAGMVVHRGAAATVGLAIVTALGAAALSSADGRARS